MCGILGAIEININNGALATMAHRGPDDSGIETYRVADKNIQFGHRRLSILDLSYAGHQPMNSTCNNYSIIFNGEVYNHLELRKKLAIERIYNGHSDTETILYYLMEYGIEGVQDFNGIFAFAFLDKINKRLSIARDPFGVKPLYYHHNHNTFIFSSEIRPLKEMIEASQLDMEALGVLLRLRYNPAPDTLHSLIKKLRPGHYLTIELDMPDINPTIQAFLNVTSVPTNVSPDRQVMEYGSFLENAVKRQLLADVDVGVLLSGGIDSAVIALLAKKYYAGNLKAFTIGFEGASSVDEIEDAAETAEILGIEHYCKKISFSDFIGNIRECSRIVEEPLATTSLVPMYFLSELASKHVKVVLTGQGADEPLGGYFRYKSELLRGLIPGFFRGSIQPFVKFFGVQQEAILRGASVLGIKNEIDRFLASYEVFSEEEIFRLISVRDRISRERLHYFYDLLECRSKNSSVEAMMALDARLNLADDLLNYTDKITMNFSLECRVPMLDLELVRFIGAVPTGQKLNMLGGKLIHKKFAQSILPQKIISRKKRGFQSPTNQWFKKEIKSIGDILLAPGTHFSMVFSRFGVEAILNQHAKGYNKEKQIFLFLSIYFWLESIKQ